MRDSKKKIEKERKNLNFFHVCVLSSPVLVINDNTIMKDHMQRYEDEIRMESGKPTFFVAF